ncbi:MAG: hypothetical protein HYU68_01255 [Bacteroidetes bacterium]|nr:hypothetical protein [Bacteroidota bacterium]
MLKFINKQLSQKELHEVQKHLIDCDFCSEALEGLKYAKNSSVLFNIDHKITTRTHQKTIPFARIILVAASVLFIAVGGYYTITNFNEVVQLKENEISYQEPIKNMEPMLAPQEEQLQEQKEPEGDKITVIEEDRTEAKADEKASDYYRFADEKNKDSDVSKKEAQGYVSQQAVSPNTITTSGSTYKTELAESDDALMDIESTVTQDKTVLKESRIDSDSYRGGTKSDANFDQLAKNQAPNKVVSADKEKEKKSIDTKQRAKKAMEAPSSVSVSDELKNSTDKDTEEKLERETISRNDNISTNETVSFSEASGGLATGSTTNSRSALTDGIADFNAKKYTEAIQNFDLILAESPTTTKTYEAKWYKALCLIELKDITAAKKLLNELTYVNNPFSKKAEDKLKELE